MKRFIVITFALGLTACAGVQLRRGAKNVYLTKYQQDVSKCEFVGKVVASPPYFNGEADRDAKLQNAAVELGADSVLVMPGGLTDTTGHAYKCPPEVRAQN